MGKGKKVNHQMRDKGINQESITKRMEATNDGEDVKDIPLRALGIVGKLQSPDAHVREEACLDISSQVLDLSQLSTLRKAGAHVQLSYLIDDEVLEIRQGAASALRNFFTTGRDEVIDEVVQHENGQFLERFGKSLLAQFGQVEADGQDGETTPTTKTLDEMLQLVSVLVEGCEQAANIFSSEPKFLNLLLECLQHQGAVQISAAECLYIISDENEPVAEYLGSSLTDQQQELLNNATSSVPHSPALLRSSVLLCGALLNCSTSVENVRRVMPVIVAAISTTPMKEARKLLPLLSTDCEMVEEVREMGVAQCFDRLRALQQALDIFGNIVALVCEANADEDDDEQALAKNPHADILFDSGILDSIVDCVTSVVSPMEDVVVRSAIRNPCDTNADVSTMQGLFLSSEVAILGTTSALLHMISLDRFGDTSIMWNVCVGSINDRISLADEHPQHAEMYTLQIESLAEMCWTVQRKDVNSITNPQQEHLDIFTRLAWQDGTSSSTRVFVIGTIGCIGTRVANADVTFVCGKFMSGMLSIDDLEVQAEAANTIMDLFSDERYDESAYKPLDLQSTISQFVPHLNSCITQMGKRTARREHYFEIRDNLQEFLKYKKKNVRW